MSFPLELLDRFYFSLGYQLGLRFCIDDEDKSYGSAANGGGDERAGGR